MDIQIGSLINVQVATDININNQIMNEKKGLQLSISFIMIHFVPHIFSKSVSSIRLLPIVSLILKKKYSKLIVAKLSNNFLLKLS